jgi:AcrR family transcriptional regulator
MDTISGVAPEPVDPAVDEQFAEGLRERKKRLTRQLLSDTATSLFLEKGFDGFRVTEVAEACGVSEKTVYNYFPTKESLILDREEDLAVSIRAALGPDGSGKSPVDAILDVLASERQQMRAGLADMGSEELGLQMFRRFLTMLDDTPQLLAASIEMLQRLAQVTAESLAERAGISPDDPEPTIAGHALVGLWDVQFKAMRRHAGTAMPVDEVYATVAAEVDRAARLIDTGLWSFSTMTAGAGSREQFKTAAEAAQHAGRQVAAALKQARKVWSEVQAAHAASGAGPWPGEDIDWHAFAGMDPADPNARQHWREMQRQVVQQWREAQREHSQQWREASRTYRQEQQAAKRRLKDDLRESASSQQARRARRTEGRP